MGVDGTELKPDEFRLLRDLFSARTGLSFGSESRFAVARRLRERIAILGLANFGDYYHYLRFNPRAEAEWDEAIDLVTTNETYFFREPAQLRSFERELLPLFVKQAHARRRLAIWSAGCSTGEEVYTIAMIVDASGLFKGWDVHIYGSDLSRRCVATARRGAYGPAAFRACPAEYRRSYFVEREPGDGPAGVRTLQVVDPIRQMCHFGQVNLLREERARVLGRADAVFCRNVLIYLEPHARRRIIDVFHERLYPGGVLLLGHSESLLNVSTAFELLHLREDLVYRKPSTLRTSP